MDRRTHSIGRWIGYGAGALFVVAVFALIVGTGYQYLENRRDLREHPAPGQLVDVGGHRLHIWCTGEGSPVVVLEVGGGGNVLEWSRVQPEVAKTTRVCSYDRAGFGWSDLGPSPRSAVQIVRELHTLLQAAHVPAPTYSPDTCAASTTFAGQRQLFLPVTGEQRSAAGDRSGTR